MKIKDPTEKKRILVLNSSLIGVFILLTGGGYLWAGVDFAKGTLVGCLVVAINFFISQRLVGNLILEGSIKPTIVVAYLSKLGVSVLILFVAVVRWQLDLVGILLGLSSIVLATILTTFVKKQPEKIDA